MTLELRIPQQGHPQNLWKSTPDFLLIQTKPLLVSKPDFVFREFLKFSSTAKGDVDAFGKDPSAAECMGTDTSAPQNMSSAGRQPGYCEV